MPGQPNPLVGVPIKPFGVAKRRLEGRLSTASRSRLGKAIAARTLDVIRHAGVDVMVVTADRGVMRWADALGISSIDEASNLRGLDGAAEALQESALRTDRAWLMVHADLPLIESSDVVALLQPSRAGDPVIAPSHDGGTSALGATDGMATSYGIGSYHRHLRRLHGLSAMAEGASQPVVVMRPGLAYDLDTVPDLEWLLANPAGAWLADAISTIDSAT